MYQPSQEILYKYADVLVNFALWQGKGINKGDSVFVYIPECAKPLYIPLQETILKAGGFPIMKYLPDGVTKNYYEYANEEQLKFVLDKTKKAEIEEKTHHLGILAEADKHELDGVDTQKIMTRIKTNKPYRELLAKKEDAGEFTRTIALFGTQAMADEVNLSLEEYREEIIKACFLDHEDPKTKRRETFDEIDKTAQKLNNTPIEKLHIQGEDIDLTVKLGTERKRVSGRWVNIPSFEIFTSPDRRGTNGKIKFNQPLYRYWSLIKGIELEFKDGIVIKASAEENNQLLQDMISIPGMERVGEYSLTDKRTSRITKFMGETLYDENVGGEFGNTHLALGRSFSEAYKGDISELDEAKKEELGYNTSAEHVDIMSTTDRTVTATLTDGTEKIIYKDGMFVL